MIIKYENIYDRVSRRVLSHISRQFGVDLGCLTSSEHLKLHTY